MKKSLIILLVAVLAVTAVFAHSGVSAKAGYDVMSFGGKFKTQEQVLKYNGISFGIKGNFDVYKNYAVTASVDGLVPFFEKEIDNKSWSRTSGLWGLKAKLGVSASRDVSKFSFSAGVDGIFSALFGSNTYLNFGIGAQLAAAYSINNRLSVGASFAPELMFGTTYVSNTGWSKSNVNLASPACSAQLSLTCSF